MGKDADFRAGQPRGVHDAGVNELVENENVALADQRGDGAQRGGIARGESQRGFRALERGQRLLQLVKRRERAADQPRRARARAKFFHGGAGGGFQRGVIREAEVVVGRKIQQGPAADFDARPRRGIHPAQFAQQIPFAQGIQA